MSVIILYIIFVLSISIMQIYSYPFFIKKYPQKKSWVKISIPLLFLFLNFTLFPLLFLILADLFVAEDELGGAPIGVMILFYALGPFQVIVSHLIFKIKFDP